MIHFGKNGQDYIVIETDKAITLSMTRAEAKALARFIMIELNIIEFYLNDGRAGHDDPEFKKMLLEKYGQINKLTK